MRVQLTTYISFHLGTIDDWFSDLHVDVSHYVVYVLLIVMTLQKCSEYGGKNFYKFLNDTDKYGQRVDDWALQPGDGDGLFKCKICLSSETLSFQQGRRSVNIQSQLNIGSMKKAIISSHFLI